MLPRLFLFSLILFCFELGIFLLLLPWTSLWEQNYFLYRYPSLSWWWLNYHLRGAISGLGLLDVGLAAWYGVHFRAALGQLGRPSPAPPAVQESLRRGPLA